MNPRQRRAVLLLGLSVLGLLGVFALVASYVSDVRTEVGPKITLLALTEAAQPYKSISDDMVKEVVMPEKWAPKAAIRDRAALVGLVPTSTLREDSILQEGMLSAPPDLESGQRKIAILVDAETGVAGNLGPGSIVDIIATYPGTEDGRARARSRIVVPAAKVVDVGQTRLQGRGRIQDEQTDPEEVVPITFALTVQQQLKVTYAESIATEVRLGLQRPDEQNPIPPARERVYAPEVP